MPCYYFLLHSSINPFNPLNPCSKRRGTPTSDVPQYIFICPLAYAALLNFNFECHVNNFFIGFINTLDFIRPFDFVFLCRDSAMCKQVCIALAAPSVLAMPKLKQVCFQRTPSRLGITDASIVGFPLRAAELNLLLSLLRRFALVIWLNENVLF